MEHDTRGLGGEQTDSHQEFIHDLDPALLATFAKSQLMAKHHQQRPGSEMDLPLRSAKFTGDQKLPPNVISSSYALAKFINESMMSSNGGAAASSVGPTHPPGRRLLTCGSDGESSSSTASSVSFDPHGVGSGSRGEACQRSSPTGFSSVSTSGCNSISGEDTVDPSGDDDSGRELASKLAAQLIFRSMENGGKQASSTQKDTEPETSASEVTKAMSGKSGTEAANSVWTRVSKLEVTSEEATEEPEKIEDPSKMTNSDMFETRKPIKFLTQKSSQESSLVTSRRAMFESSVMTDEVAFRPHRNHIGSKNFICKQQEKLTSGSSTETNSKEKEFFNLKAKTCDKGDNVPNSGNRLASFPMAPPERTEAARSPIEAKSVPTNRNEERKRSQSEVDKQRGNAAMPQAPGFSGKPVLKNDPAARKLVYSQYREMLKSYSKKSEN